MIRKTIDEQNKVWQTVIREWASSSISLGSVTFSLCKNQKRQLWMWNCWWQVASRTSLVSDKWGRTSEGAGKHGVRGEVLLKPRAALVVTSTHLEIQVSLKIKRDIFLSEKENGIVCVCVCEQNLKPKHSKSGTKSPNSKIQIPSSALGCHLSPMESQWDLPLIWDKEALLRQGVKGALRCHDESFLEQWKRRTQLSTGNASLKCSEVDVCVPGFYAA